MRKKSDVEIKKFCIQSILFVIWQMANTDINTIFSLVFDTNPLPFKRLRVFLLNKLILYFSKDALHCYSTTVLNIDKIRNVS